MDRIMDTITDEALVDALLRHEREAQTGNREAQRRAALLADAIRARAGERAAREGLA